MTTNTDQLSTSEPANSEQLITELNDVLNGSTAAWERFQDAERIRDCIWLGQERSTEPDRVGRRWEQNLRRKVLPWDGASDAVVYLALEIVLEHADQMQAALLQGVMQAIAHDSDDLASSAVHSSLLRYLVKTQMQPELGDELAHAAVWRESYGAVCFHVTWEEESRLQPSELTAEQVFEGMFQQILQSGRAEDEEAALAMAQQEFEDLRRSLDSADQVTGLAESMRVGLPHLTMGQLRAVIEEFRDTGRATFPEPAIAVSRPRWEALRPLIDVFFPLETTRLQRAPWIARFEYLTEADLRNRIESDKWDKKVVEKIIAEQRGKWYNAEARDRLRASNRYTSGVLESSGVGWQDSWSEQHLFEVIRFYHERVDRKGFPVRYETILHGSDDKLVCAHRVQAEKHGLMPFFDSRHDYRSKLLVESMGVPEMVKTHQAEIKRQHDMTADRSEIATNPTLKVPSHRAGTSYPVGPGAQIPARRGQEPDYLKPPPLDNTTILVTERVEARVNRFYGRLGDHVPPEVAFPRQQVRINHWLSHLTEGVRLTWALAQQYMEPINVAQVVGAENAAALKVTREEIQGRFDFNLEFDVRDADAEHVKNKISAVSDILVPLDVHGQLDRSVVLEVVVRSIFPTLASRILRPPQVAAEQELEDERLALAMIMSGVEAPLKEGQDHAARLQFLQEQIQSNPAVAAMLQQQQGEGSDEKSQLIGQMLQQRLQVHQHQLQQRENAQIGRLGGGMVTG